MALVKVATDWIDTARNTDAPEPLPNRSPERFEVLTGNTSDHRPGVGEDLGDNQSDDERIRSSGETPSRLREMIRR